MTHASPDDYHLDELVTLSEPATPPKRRQLDKFLTSRAVLDAVGETLAEERAARVALERRIAVLERASADAATDLESGWLRIVEVDGEPMQTVDPTQDATLIYVDLRGEADPEAAAIVLESGIDFTMVGLNISHQALITRDVRARIAALGSPLAAFAVELLEFFCRTNDEVFGMPDGPLHDAVAVAVLADPDAVRRVHTRLDVELAGTETVGATSVDLDAMLRREPNAWVATGLDVERFWDAVEEALARLA